MKTRPLGSSHRCLADPVSLSLCPVSPRARRSFHCVEGSLGDESLVVCASKPPCSKSWKIGSGVVVVVLAVQFASVSSPISLKIPAGNSSASKVLIRGMEPSWALMCLCCSLVSVVCIWVEVSSSGLRAMHAPIEIAALATGICAPEVIAELSPLLSVVAWVCWGDGDDSTMAYIKSLEHQDQRGLRRKGDKLPQSRLRECGGTGKRENKRVAADR